MRTKAKVVGIGMRKSGTRKDGSKYDFTTLHLVYPDKDTEGLAAACPGVDQSILDCIPMPKVNDEIEIFYHISNFSMKVDGIL